MFNIYCGKYNVNTQSRHYHILELIEMLQLIKPLNFGDEITLRSIDWLENYPWREENTVKTEYDKYVINLAVKDFAPDEIKVKTADGTIIVEGKHEERQDEHGFVSRQFKRKYKLPVGCQLENAISKLSHDGILMITVPRSLEQDTIIPVSHEGGKVKSKL
uniref:Heat shock protein 18.6 n=1 Tax=Antheraea pernyi TaxID=7119 RepID=A0A2H4G8P1_ANTPE|nr:heat shock protein 18.6 [Antheraea pernyi]